MPGFLYFVPNQTFLRREDLVALGLAYAFESPAVSNRGVSGGPAGQDGVLVAGAGLDGSQVLYVKDRQTWRQIPQSTVWVGYETAAPPSPDDLARADQLDGYWLELADGQRWLVPIARGYRESADEGELKLYWSLRLPQRLELAADGRWTDGGILPRYAALWDFAQSWLALRCGTAGEEDVRRLDAQGRIDAAVLALQANYQLSRVEAALLGLLTDQHCVAILDRLIDWPKVEQFQKKMTSRLADRVEATPQASPAGSLSPAGATAETPTTDPASAT